MDNKKNLRNLLIYLGAPILIIIIMAGIYGNVKPQKAHKYSEIVGYFKSQQVIDYTMDLGSGERRYESNVYRAERGDYVRRDPPLY